MPPHHCTKISGTITHVFFHRFVVETQDGARLADLGPKGLEHFPVCIGDHVVIEGESKPSELKVLSIGKRGGEAVEIEYKKPHEKPHADHHPHTPADPEIALHAARQAGFETLGHPRRKPKHFEILGKKAGKACELHIDLDGSIRKDKPVDADDPKWASELTTA